MDFPEKKPVASLLEQPQILAVEIRIDRVDLIRQRLVDVEDLALWVQVLDLPCMEMSPYQRDRLNSSSESLSSYENRSIEESFTTNQSVKLAKKSSGLIAGEPDMNKSEAEFDRDLHRRKWSVKRKSLIRKERLKKSSKKHETSPEDKKWENLEDEIAHKKSHTSSRTLSFKIDEIKKNDEGMMETNFLPVIAEKDSRFVSKETFRDEESIKKIRLLTKLMEVIPEESPEGIAFNSDCCILVPCSSVSNTLYKMQRMPIIIYLVHVNSLCSKLIGEMCCPLDYCFQEAVVKAAKMKGGLVTHAVQQSFPLYNGSESCKLKVGNLFGSIKLLCYGRFGMTEVKSPSGDLMTGRLREWKADYRDLSQGLGGEGIDVEQQPYGFRPTITRNTLPPLNERRCPSTTPVRSMFDFVRSVHKPIENLSNQSNHN